MKHQKGELGIGGWIIALVLVLVVGAGIVVLVENQTKPKGPTVADVAKNPENFYGQQLTLKGEIENIKTPRIFTLDEEGTVAGDEVLVVSIPAVEPQGGGPEDISALNEQDVLVNGTVRRFVSADIKRQTGLDLDPQIVVDFENKPVIIAREVELIPEDN